MGVFNGFKLALFTAKNLFSLKAHNDLVRSIRPLHRIELRQGTSISVLYSDLNVVLTYVPGNANGAGSQYKGEYDSEADYSTGDEVRVSPGNAISTVTIGADGSLAGVYIAVKDAPAGSLIPRNPIQPGGECEFWNWKATWPKEHTVCNNGTEETWIVDSQKQPEEA